MDKTFCEVKLFQVKPDKLDEFEKLIAVVAKCKCQYKNDQKVENKNVHFPRSIPQFVFP